MTTVDGETTEPSGPSAPSGPLNRAITTAQAGAPTTLADFVRQAMTELPAITGADRATAHRYFDDFALRRLPAALATARQDTVTAAVAPLADMFADAGGMVQLSREQARGRAGDFEIIEYLLRAQPAGVPGTWGHHFDDYLLHAPITDQHRNKIAHQAALIESLLGSDPAHVPGTTPARAAGRRVLLIAAGGAADLRRVDPAFLRPTDRLVLNDVDPDALAHALTHLPPATRAQTVTAPGNILRTAARLAADHGPFDLVLAGGLFDYLEERFARALIRTALSRLCRPGGTFYLSNIAAPNPYAALMTHIGRWNLVERTPAIIEADIRAAVPPETVAALDITTDTTGLTLFATVRRADQPG